jgi:hypothetical protein
MNIPAHDFVTVDMRGLKGALVTRAQAERVSVSAVVRRAVERELQVADAAADRIASAPAAAPAASTVKLSIRLTSAEAEQLAAGARRAGLSRGAFLGALLTSAPRASANSASRPECLAALNASCAELSTFSRNLHHLTSLLRHGQVQAALAYREMLDTIDGHVRAHLRMAAGVLAELRPAPPRARADVEPGAHRPRMP